MKNSLLFISMTWLLTLVGCDTHTNTNSVFVIPSSVLTETSILANGTGFTLNWTAATASTTTTLYYTVYESPANPAYGSFTSLNDLESGTLVGSGSNITSLAVTGLTPGSSYYFNIVVADGNGNLATYATMGDYFDASLVLFYPFDNSTNDISIAGSNNGVASTTSPTATTDRFGHANSAYLFTNASNNSFTSGTSQYITSTSNTGISAAGPFTLSFWYAGVTGHTYSGDRLVSMGANTENNVFGFYPQASNSYVWVFDGGSDLATGVTPSTTAWQHWVLVYDSSKNVTAYMNGTKVVNAINIPNLSLTASPLYLGVAPDQSTTGTAYLDDVRVYNTALSSSAVSLLYTTTRP